MWPTKLQILILPSMVAKANRSALPQNLFHGVPRGTLFGFMNSIARLFGTCQYSPWTCTANYGWVPTANLVCSLCDSPTAVVHCCVRWNVSCHGNVTTGAIYAEKRNRSFSKSESANSEPTSLAGPRTQARRSCSTWNTVILIRRTTPWKSHRSKSSRKIRFNLHSLGTNSRVGHLRLVG